MLDFLRSGAKDYLSHEEKINTSQGNKTVRIIVIFDNYGSKEFKLDFKEFCEYQTKNYHEKNTLKYFDKVAEFKEIPFDYFKNSIITLFNKVVYNLVKENNYFLMSDEINFQFKLMRYKGYSFEIIAAASDQENYCIDASGLFFIQNIIAPFYYFKHIDYQRVYKYMLHEFVHLLENAKKSINWDNDSKFDQRLRKFSKRSSAYNLNCLYLSLFNLRAEGFADYIARKNSLSYIFSMKGIRTYNDNLKKLVRLPWKKDCEPFYENQISYVNQTYSSEYANGMFMCITIALGISKEKKYSYEIIADKEQFFGYQHPMIDHLLSKYDAINIKNLSKEAFEESIDKIQSIHYYSFVALYEKECDLLGITEKNRIMTKNRFHNLHKEAVSFAKKRQSDNLKKNGFCFWDSQIENDEIVKTLEK